MSAVLQDHGPELLRAYEASGMGKKVIVVKNGGRSMRVYCLTSDEKFLADVALCCAPLDDETEQCFLDATGRCLVVPSDTVVMPLPHLRKRGLTRAR